MKNLIGKSARAALMALVASVAMAGVARAQVTFSYEDSISGRPIGTPFSGPFRINLQNFENGALYPSLGAPGTAAGFGAGGGAASVAGGITALNALETTAPTGRRGSEDLWGIARVLTITDLAGSVVWSEAGKNAEMTIMFWGGQDFYINQLAGGFQEIDAVGIRADWWIQSRSAPGYTQYNPLLGSAGRTGVSEFTSVTDGTRFLQTLSTPGFIHPAGTLGGVATEFASVFNITSGGSGQMYMNVIGGTQGADFDTNAFVSPFIPGATADLFAQFTTTLNTPTVGDWLVRSNDPVQGAFVPIPEPSTYGLIGAGVLLGLVAWRRRRQKPAQA